MYSIVMGIPEMRDFWSTLCSKVKSGSATKDEVRLQKKMGKALFHLQQSSRYPGLETHEITSLSRRYGTKAWQSYIDDKTPAAGRTYWCCGLNRGEITIIGLEPHPNDKANAYDKITLSFMGEVIGQ